MLASDSTRRWVLFCGTWALGTLFVTAAGLKAVDLDAFARQISRYQIVPPSLESAVAVSLVLLEAALGAAALSGFHPAKVLRGMIALLTLFLAATVLRWGVLEGTDCHCFGPIMAGGPASVLLHTTLLIALAGGFIKLSRRVGASRPLRGPRLAAGLVAMFFIMFIAQGFLTGSPSAPTGDQVRIFISATCQKCLQDSRKVQDLFDAAEVAPVRVFIGASSEQQIKDYLRSGDLRVDYTPVTFSQLARETQRVPKVQVFRAGKIVRDWDGEVPSIEEVRRVLTSAEGAGDTHAEKSPTGGGG